MSEFQALIGAALKGAAANVGPLIGVDLEVGEVSLEEGVPFPEGDFAIMPMQSDVDNQKVTEVYLLSPLNEIATLGRRMLDDSEPDKTRDISADELDAIGEVLNLMSGAVDASVRAELSPRVHTRPLRWWRSSEPGENQPPGGTFTIGSAQIQIASAGTVQLQFAIPPALASAGKQGEREKSRQAVFLLGIDSELQGELQPVLEGAGMQVVAAEPDDEVLEESLPKARAIFLSAERAGAIQICRKLRTGNKTWTVPVIYCMREPTRSGVIEAVAAGAITVLAIPAEDITLLRVLSSVQERAA